MSKRYFFSIVTLLGVLFLLSPALKAQSEAEGKVRAKNPIVITSKSLSADNRTNSATFEGSVMAESNNMKLYSDRMRVFYSAEGGIKEINADGHVKLVGDNRAVTSEKAVYMAAEQKIVFTGNPKAVEGSNVVTGTKMIYLIAEDRSIVENSKVFLEQELGAGKAE